MVSVPWSGAGTLGLPGAPPPTPAPPALQLLSRSRVYTETRRRLQAQHPSQACFLRGTHRKKCWGNSPSSQFSSVSRAVWRDAAPERRSTPSSGQGHRHAGQGCGVGEGTCLRAYGTVRGGRHRLDPQLGWSLPHVWDSLATRWEWPRNSARGKPTGKVECGCGSTTGRGREGGHQTCCLNIPLLPSLSHKTEAPRWPELCLPPPLSPCRGHTGYWLGYY